MERGLIGILLICLVGSTVAVMFLVGERITSPVEILKVEYPERFEPGEPKRFALNVLARKPVEELVVEYSYLYRVRGVEIEQLYATEGFNESILQDDEPWRFLTVPLGTEEMRENLPGEVGFETQLVKVPFTYRREFEVIEDEISVRFYDYRQMIEWVPESASPFIYGASACFAVAWIPEGNISYYRGTPDFYLNRHDSMSDLSYGKNETSLAFVNPKIREAPEGYVHVNDAPPFGRIVYGSLEKGQRAFLSFTTRDVALPAIQVVRFYVNGELLEDETRMNMMGYPL